LISTSPCPLVKFVTRPPASAKPSQVDAEECSLSGSMKRSFSPQRFFWPLETAAEYPPPMVVEEVIGYAQAACVMLISAQTTAPEPSVIVGTPLKRGFPLPEEPLMQSSIGKSHCIAVRWATSERGPRPSNRAV